MCVKTPLRVHTADILVLSTLASKTPAAIAWHNHPNQQNQQPWALSHGFGPWQAEAPELFEILAANPGPVEIKDLRADAPGCKLTDAPHEMRWMLGSAIRDSDGRPCVALALLDRTVRQPPAGDYELLRLLVRRLTGTLTTAPHNDRSEMTTATTPSRPSAPASSTLRSVPDIDHPLGPLPPDRLLRTSEVARLFNVTDRTVLNWATAGHIPTIRTIGGHLRFRANDVLRLIPA